MGIDFGDVICHDFRAEAHCLSAHVFHQLRTHDSFFETREVFNLGGIHECTTGGDCPFKYEWIQLRSGGVDGSRVTSRSRTNDDDVTNITHRESQLPFDTSGRSQG